MNTNEHLFDLYIYIYICDNCFFSVLDRVQSFLPQMAQANDELKRKMVTAPAHEFDIEHLDSETEKVIEMVNMFFYYFNVNIDGIKITL